jgi:hypothetical protein
MEGGGISQNMKLATYMHYRRGLAYYTLRSQYTYIHGLVTAQTRNILMSFLVWPPLPNHRRRAGLLSHLITLNDTHTHIHTPLARTHLDEGSTSRRDL